MSGERWVCFDIGETLIDETRVWSTWADLLGVPRFTLLAALGGAIARGQGHVGAFPVVGAPNWRQRVDDFERAYGGFRADDLYPDALPALRALRDQGLRVAVIGNQPAARSADLRRLGVPADPILMSAELGAEKPTTEFFSALLHALGGPEPSHVAYVGDRVDNDVVPAADAGLCTVWVRRGPWGRLQQPPPMPPALTVDSLDELTRRVSSLWPVL